ncbi:MAG: hypothetical protein H0W36_00535 [Gemmatimonadetes bacterium]|nr:hypothetical protein [Gemmatimonadota bacterium]
MSKLSLSVEKVERQAKTVALAPLDDAMRMLAAASDPMEIKHVESLAAAAKRYANSLEARNYAAEIQLRAGRKGGQILIDMADNGTRADHPGVGNGPLPTLSDLGIEPMRSSRWQWLARKSEIAFETYLAQTKANAESITLAGLGTSDTAEWYTPPKVIERVVATLGEIDLDPCSNSYGDPRIPAQRHYRESDDGLARPWVGRVYMNPPYGLAIGAWVDKLAEEYESGRCTEAIALVPARTDTSWWAHLPASLVCFVTGRLAFSDHDTPAPFPSAACYLGKNDKAFAAEFLSLGLVYVRLEVEG